MPGLIRGVARTAVIAGTATSVSNRVSRRQAARWAHQDAQAYGRSAQVAPMAAPMAASSGETQGDKIQMLKELGELKASGVLTEQEFEAQKAKILAG